MVDIQHHPGTLLIILAGRFKGKRKVSTHREKDDQMAVDGALIKAIELGISDKLIT
ncbi:hypothetical protein Bca52824_093129 [Brassica carinata]|uniref:Uncharacterized protein n=1 Tax=Brassica carinata TaxID=52824 RepID=A0A8X7P6A9_BRACI|nr:hypothetical protein Bca52824_093129 [Brassica carinata]